MSEVALIEPQPEPWHRQPKETAQAFHAFNIWRNLPPPRTIREAARIQAETRRGKVETVYTQFRAWAIKHNWQDRGDAFDAVLDRQRIAARETERQRIDREQMLEGRYLRSSAILRFTGGVDQAGNPVEAVDWNALDADSAMTAYRLGRDTERQAAGMQIGATLGMIPLAHARQIVEDVFEVALTFIPEAQKQAFVLRVQAIAEASR